MYPSRHPCRVRFVTLLLISELLAVIAHAQAVRYRVVPILSPFGTGRVSANDINRRGWIAATSFATGVQPQAFLWKNGETVVLPTLGGMCNFANGINSFGHVAGTACLAGDTVKHASLWRHNRAVDLDTFGGIGSAASGVNRYDDVTGDYVLSDGSVRGFFWRDGSWTDLGSLGGSFTFPVDLNDVSLVTGQSDISIDPDPVFGIPPFHGFVWSAGVLSDFGQIFGSNFNFGNAIDSTGRIVGSADLAGDVAAHAILWDRGSVQDIGAHVPDQVSWALDINSKGQIVGSSGSFDPFPEDGPPVNTILCPCHGFLWEKDQATFLDSLVEPGWTFLLALHINDRGEIIAVGQQNGGALQRVVLEPIKRGGSTKPLAATVNAAGTDKSRLSSGTSRMRRDGRAQIWLEP